MEANCEDGRMGRKRGNSLETIASMSKLYQPYAQANKDAKDMQELATDYRQQADECTQKAVEAAEKVRMGLARPEDEYNGLQQQRKYLQDQADAAQKQADDLRKKSGDLKQQMEKLAAKQTHGMLEESELFDSAEEAAADFAKRAMPLTDNTAHEYSAIMTEVQVPEYRDGQMQMVPKYKYGDITSGELNNVVNNALAGLMTPSEGKKYLLHTHPDNPPYDPDHFSGLPYNPFNSGDASIPTLAGSQWYQLPQLLNNVLTNIEGMGNPVTNAVLQALQNVTGKQLSGYDGIYLAAPTGKLYLYEGAGDNTNKLTDAKQKEGKPESVLENGLPKTKGKWNNNTGKYEVY